MVLGTVQFPVTQAARICVGEQLCKGLPLTLLAWVLLLRHKCSSACPILTHTVPGVQSHSCCVRKQKTLLRHKIHTTCKA